MHVVAFNGSPHKEGNTYQALQAVLGEIEKEGITTEIVQVGGNLLYGCQDCGWCKTHNTACRCGLDSDAMNGFIEKMAKADGIVIGSPVYFGSMTPETKALIDRAGRVTRNNGGLLKRKVGAAVVCARRAGTNYTYAGINYLFGISEMVVPSSSYWNMSLCGAPGAIQEDAEGLGTFRKLGENIAWTLKKLAAE